MGNVLMTGFGGGGVTSDDVTAIRKTVVEGYTTVTRDSDDEVVEGTLPNKGNGGVHTPAREFWYHDPVKGYVLRFDEGAYYQDGQYKPWVHIPTSLAKQAVGYNPDHTLETAYVCNEKGRIKVIDTSANNYLINRSNEFGVDPQWSNMWITLPHRSAYYTRPDNTPHVSIDAARLGDAPAHTILQGHSATSRHGLAVQGTMGRWVCHTGDVITALNNEGRVWDDAYAGRGRGVIVRIPSGHFIQNANWVFLHSPNLHANNIRQNVNINGITGTLVDYGAGRVAFNGATFDGALISGVAKGRTMRGHNTFVIGSTITYGDRDTVRFEPPFSFILNIGETHEDTYPLYYSVITNESVNLTPFRTIRIHVRHDGWIGRHLSRGKARVHVVSGLVAVRRLTGNNHNLRNIDMRGNVYDGYKLVGGQFESPDDGSVLHGADLSYDIDVSGFNEQCFLFFGVKPVNYRAGIQSTIRFTRIEFIN